MFHLNISNTERSFQQQLQLIHNKAVSFSNLQVQDYDKICYYNVVIRKSESGQTRMLHSCLTRHNFCGVLTTGKVYKVCISVAVRGFLEWVKLIKTEVLTYFIHFACG